VGSAEVDDAIDHAAAGLEVGLCCADVVETGEDAGERDAGDAAGGEARLVPEHVGR
jgi:hypothetical protein